MVVQEQMKKKTMERRKYLAEWKEKNLEEISSRMQGWQLETFKSLIIIKK